MFDDVVLLQTGSESFRILRSGHPERGALLRLHTRRGLGLAGVAPVAVATEVVHFLLERDGLPPGEIDLGAAAGRYPEFVEELRSRLGTGAS